MHTDKTNLGTYNRYVKHPLIGQVLDALWKTLKPCICWSDFLVICKSSRQLLHLQTCEFVFPVIRIRNYYNLSPYYSSLKMGKFGKKMPQFRYRSPFWQNFLSGLTIAFTAGIYVALNLLGYAFGTIPRSTEITNTSSVQVEVSQIPLKYRQDWMQHWTQSGFCLPHLVQSFCTP